MSTTNDNSTFSAKSKLRFLSAENVSITFQHAASCGNTKLVEQLLRHPNITTVTLNTAIYAAARYGYADIVALFLADPRVDPGAGDDDALCIAAGFGNSAVVELLLKHPEVNPAAEDNEPLKSAAHGLTTINSHYSVVNMLLQEQRVDPRAEHSAALRNAAEMGNIRTVKLLLEDGRSDPAACASYALHAAIYKRHYAVVAALLQDKRVDIRARDDYAMSLADLDQQLLDLLIDHTKEHGDMHRIKRLRDPEPPGMVRYYFYTPEDFKDIEELDDE